MNSDNRLSEFGRKWRQCLETADQQEGPTCIYPSLEELLEGVSDEQYGAVLRRGIEIDIWYQQELGNNPRLEDYLRRFPDYHDVVRKSFAAPMQAEPRDGVELPPLECPDCHESTLQVSAKEDSFDCSNPACGTRYTPEPKRVGAPVLARVSGYRIVGLLGQGGFGRVWIARDDVGGCYVALKTPKRKLGDAAEEWFVNEARTTYRRLSKDPRVCGRIPALLAYGIDAGMYYLAFEFVNARPLSRLQRFDQRQAAEICYEVAKTLQIAHDNGIVHLDVKPANILLNTETGFPHLTDFGIAKATAADIAEALRGSRESGARAYGFVGTPGYASPEQCRQDEVDATSDVFSLGVVLFELVSGKRPFRGESSRQTNEDVADPEKAAPRLADVMSGVSEELDHICRKCLAKHKQRRYGSAHEVATDLARFLGRDAPKPSPKPHRSVVGWAAAVVLAASVALLGWRSHRNDLETAALPTSSESAVTVDAPGDHGAETPSSSDGSTPGATSAMKAIELVHWRPGSTGDVPGGLVSSPAKFPNIRRWQIETVTPRGRIYTLKFSPNGEFLACGSLDHQLRVYDVDSGELFRLFTGHVGLVSDVAWSPNGEWLASSSSSLKSEIRVWNFETAQFSRLLHGHSQDVYTVDWHPSEPKILSCANDKKALIWDASTGAEIQTLTHEAPVTAGAWSPDGRHIATGDGSRTLRIWDNQGNVESTIATNVTNYIVSLDWSRDGTRIMVAGGSTIEIWEIFSQRLVLSVKLSKPTNRVIWCFGDTRLAATNGDDQTVHVFDLEGKELSVLNAGGPLRAIDSHHDRIAVGREDGEIIVWNPNERTERSLVNAIPSMQTIDWSNDSQRLAMASGDGSIVVWDPAREKLDVFRLADDPLTAVAWSPNDELLATGGEEGRIMLVSSHDGRIKKNLLGHTRALRCLAWATDGKALASGGQDTSIHIWAVDSGTSTRVLNQHEESVEALAWQPRGTILVSAALDNTLRFWDTKTGSALHRISESFAAHTVGLQWNQAGSQLAASNARHAIIWEPDGGRKAELVNDGDKQWRGFAWNPGGTIFAHRTFEGYLDLRDAGEGRRLARLGNASCYASNRLSWSNDGRHIASISDATRVDVYDADQFAPAWTLCNLPQGHIAVFSNAGEPLNYSPALAEYLVCYVEVEGDPPTTMKFEQFLQFIGD